MKRLFEHTAIIVSLCTMLSIYSCVNNAPSTVAPTPQPAPKAVQPAPEPSPAPEPPKPKPAPAQEEATVSQEGYHMNKQQYEATKKDLSQLVSELNSIIADRDYQKWLTYLTKDYVSYYSDPKVLEEFSQAPLLVKYNIKLRSLQDYFNYVVVASRKNVRIDDIKAINENKVRAYMTVNNEPIVVYTLERVDGKWKITR